MTSRLDKPKFLYPILLLVAALNIFFALNLIIVGDLRFHFILMNCYADQFWEGNLYPRWCFKGNGGFGALQPLFYFPLPYFISSVFYPLTHYGFNIAELFFLMCLLATFVTAIGCYHWLRSIVGPWQALLVTVCFVFLPYRMELLSYRTAYAELWLVAWLPFIFNYTRKIAVGGGVKNMVGLAVAIGLALLSHALCALIAVLFSGAYILLMTGTKWRSKIYYGAAILWGSALSAFFLVPSMYYQQYVDTPGGKAWADSAMMWNNLCHGQTMPVMARILMTIWFAVFAIYVLVERTKINDKAVRREIWVWASLGITAAFLIVSYSAFIYDFFKPYSERVFPWRIQIIMDIAVIYLLAVWSNWIFKPLHKHWWKVGYCAGLLTLLLMNTKLGDVKFQDKKFVDAIMESYSVATPEYRPRWVAHAIWSHPYITNRYRLRDKFPPQASFLGDEVKGKKQEKTNRTVTLERWKWDGIQFRTSSEKAATVVLRHQHFPIWKAVLDNKESIPITPQNETGQMMLEIPPGDHEVTLTYSVFNDNPYLIYSYWASLLAFVAVLGVGYIQCRGRKVT